MVKNEKIKTHIPGFDELIEGGFPVGSNVMVTGTPGTGKTIFSLQFLYNGITKDNEKGIYFSFEEKSQSLIDQASQFGWDIKKLQKSGKLKIVSLGTDDINKNTIKDIIEIVENTKAKRIVIDSITTLAYTAPATNSDSIIINDYTIKKFLYSFLSVLDEIENLTTILISQKDEKVSNTITEYLADGIVNIDYESLGGDYSRNLTIRKMRKVKNDEDLHPLEIRNGEGVIIHNL